MRVDGYVGVCGGFDVNCTPCVEATKAWGVGTANYHHSAANLCTVRHCVHSKKTASADRFHVCGTELEPWEQKHSFTDARKAQRHIHRTLQHTDFFINMFTSSQIQHTQPITVVFGLQLVQCLFTAETCQFVLRSQLNLALA